MEADYAITEGQSNLIDPETENSRCTLKVDMDTAENDTRCIEGPKANDGKQNVTTQNKTLKFSIFNILGLSNEEATESTSKCKYVEHFLKSAEGHSKSINFNEPRYEISNNAAF